MFSFQITWSRTVFKYSLKFFALVGITKEPKIYISKSAQPSGIATPFLQDSTVFIKKKEILNQEKRFNKVMSKL